MHKICCIDIYLIRILYSLTVVLFGLSPTHGMAGKRQIVLFVCCFVEVSFSASFVQCNSYVLSVSTYSI